MLSEIRSSLRPAFVLLALFTLLLGLAYPLAITGIAQITMPSQANGSLIKDGDRIVGSELIGQGFVGDRYFHGRPSAAGENGYDASASAATNLAPGSKDLRDAVAERVAAERAQGLTSSVPSDIVTTSASGLDPHISPEAAFAQAARVAKARGMSVGRIRALINEQSEMPVMGLFGEARVNVLLINRQLDRISAKLAR